MGERSITKKMLDVLRKHRVDEEVKAQKELAFESKENDNFLSVAKILMEEAVGKKKILKEDEDMQSTHS